MLFSSVSFLYMFLPTVIFACFIGKSRLWRNTVLLIFSLYFYSWGEPKQLILLIGTSLLAYFCGIGMAKYANRKKGIFILAVALLTGSLIFFKYLGFICRCFPAFRNAQIALPDIALPLGISFYIFQIMSYLIDLYRGNITAEKNFFLFLLYISFFPQLIMGPIVRYGTVCEELRNRNENWDDAIYGSRRFITGLAKKVLLANNMALISDTIYNASAGAGTCALWLAAVCYTLEIYFDFSGYSDMAIGLGRIFGFHFPENFHYPYVSQSISEFWRRWHISLSSWFRDYIYIPLGGNRVSLCRSIVNILAVWGLTGMWHGASWNFLLWGIINGVLLIGEKFLFKNALNRLPELLRHIYALFFITISWTVFHFEDFSVLGTVLKDMFLFRPTDWVSLLMIDTSICLKLLMIIPACIFAFPVLKKAGLPDETPVKACAVNLLYLALLAISIMFIISSSYNPFIYFNF